MDLLDAIVILNNRGIKYSFNGLSVSGNITSGQYTLVSYTEKIKSDETVELKIKATTNTPDEDIGNNDNTNDTTNDNTSPESDTDVQRNSITNIINGIFN